MNAVINRNSKDLLKLIRPVARKARKNPPRIIELFLAREPNQPRVSEATVKPTPQTLLKVPNCATVIPTTPLAKGVCREFSPLPPGKRERSIQTAPLSN